jgi:hypothetical protein
MNDELERIGKEAIMTLIDIPSWYLPGGTNENHETPVILVSAPADIRTGDLPEYVLSVTARPTSSVNNVGEPCSMHGGEKCIQNFSRNI